MHYIETAYQGRIEMFQTIGLIGKSIEEAPARPAEDATRSLTPALFDSIFAGGAA